MSKKLIPDLMVVNKIIIFLENLFDEDIDLIFFSTKIIQDVEFIANSTENILDEYIADKSLHSNSNFLKLYFTTMKRFFKVLNKVQKYSTFFNKQTKELIISLEKRTEEKIKKMRNPEYRENLLKSDAQLINEEEYNLLLNSD